MDTKNISSIKFLLDLQDSPHPLYGLESITYLPLSNWEEDVKRKGPMSEIIKRLSRLEERVRKLEQRT